MVNPVTRRGFYGAGARQLLRLFTRGLDGLQASRRATLPPAPAFLRPPGTRPGLDLAAACAGCLACAQACPKAAIRKAGPELGAAVADTPILDPLVAPCWLCLDLPCIAACPRGVLEPLASRADVRLGIARVATIRCYAAQGSICEACQDGCPIAPRAIRVGIGSPPQVRVDRCTGCGVCAWLCPASAITIVPAAAMGGMADARVTETERRA